MQKFLCPIALAGDVTPPPNATLKTFPFLLAEAARLGFFYKNALYKSTVIIIIIIIFFWTLGRYIPEGFKKIEKVI